jgi:hypothetical protein
MAADPGCLRPDLVAERSGASVGDVKARGQRQWWFGRRRAVGTTAAAVSRAGHVGRCWQRPQQRVGRRRWRRWPVQAIIGDGGGPCGLPTSAAVLAHAGCHRGGDRGQLWPALAAGCGLPWPLPDSTSYIYSRQALGCSHFSPRRCCWYGVVMVAGLGGCLVLASGVVVVLRAASSLFRWW